MLTLTIRNKGRKVKKRRKNEALLSLFIPHPPLNHYIRLRNWCNFFEVVVPTQNPTPGQKNQQKVHKQRLYTLLHSKFYCELFRVRVLPISGCRSRCRLSFEYPRIGSECCKVAQEALFASLDVDDAGSDFQLLSTIGNLFTDLQLRSFILILYSFVVFNLFWLVTLAALADKRTQQKQFFCHETFVCRTFDWEWKWRESIFLLAETNHTWPEFFASLFM